LQRYYNSRSFLSFFTAPRILSPEQPFFWRNAMTVVMMISALAFAAQSAPAATQPAPEAGAEAAYEQLAAGANQDAIARIQAALAQNPGAPALLTSLGTAYSREGRVEEARAACRNAIAAEERYRVQLADGSWEDSRRVARIALDCLDRTAFAAR